MHIEVLVEDISGAKLLAQLLPQILGEQGEPHTWRLIKPYKGIGGIPKGLTAKADPAKRILLDQLPRLLRGYGKTPGIDAVVVVLDTDRRDCKAFLQELKSVVAQCEPAPKTMFRLAVEEIEAWYLGDRMALLKAFPRAKRDVLDRYEQYSVCGTWELLADAVHAGGAAAIKKGGWQMAGQLRDAEMPNVLFMASAGGMQCEAQSALFSSAKQAICNEAMRPPVPSEMGHLAFPHPLNMSGPKKLTHS